MVIYLVRHAEAVERAEGLEDSTRWLSKKGRKSLQKAASRLRKNRVRPDLIITSPLTRAVQTAELLMVEVGSRAELIANNNLAPESTAEQVVELIYSRQGTFESILLVGHEPLLAQAAALLLKKERVAGLAKGSCLSLELHKKPEKPARFNWYAAAGKMIRSAKKALVPAE